ncbi:MAG: hypothetical protein HXY50_05595, partial [Ignavibacteriaceae bacterium]|nr:hypothetical protein [Ignavibacteriaceae bacterium]
MKLSFNLLLIITLTGLWSNVFSQNYQGPAAGSVAGGAVVTTGTFAKSNEIGIPRERGKKNVVGYEHKPSYVDFENNSNIIASAYTEDKFITGSYS